MMKDPPELAVKFNRAIVKHFKPDDVSVREVMIACGAILEGYIGAPEVPVEDRRGLVDEFCDGLRSKLLAQ